MVTFGLGPLLQCQMRRAKLKSAYNLLIIDHRGLQCETNLYQIMDWETSGVLRFDLEPLLQGQTRIGTLITCLLLVLEACNVKPTYRKSWVGNILMLSGLTFGPSFKVKQWFTGFGELSVQ